MSGTEKKSAKILQFRTQVQYPEGLTRDDAETVETIMQVMAGAEVAIEDIEFTERPLREIEKSLQGESSSESGAWTFPTKRWSFENSRGKRGQLVVIDVGEKRAMYFHEYGKDARRK